MRVVFRIHGPTLTRLRVARGLTQTEVAAGIHVDRTSISRLERGDRVGTPAQIVTLAEFFGVTIDELCAVPIEGVA